MKLGIFAKTFSRPTIEELFQSIASYGIYSVQFNLSCAGLETLPENVPSELVQQNSRLCRTGQGRIVCDLRYVQYGSPQS